MTEVVVTKSINVPASEVWGKLSSFSGIENYSPIARSVVQGQGVGATRTCFMPDNAEIHETLNKLNHESMHLEYQINSGPFPIENYVSTVDVKAVDASNTEVTWGANFEVEAENENAMKDLFGGFYNIIIESLENVIKSEN